MTPPPATLPGLFFAQAARRGGAVALRRKELGIWTRVSWTDYAERVRAVAAALLAGGLRPGQPVAVFGDNRPEWLYCSLGAMAARGVTCGIYSTSAPEQLQYLLRHSQAPVLFVQGAEHLEKALSVLHSTPVGRVIVWERKGLWGFADPRVGFFDDFLAAGRTALAARPGAVDEALAAAGPQDAALLIYTSGTTGEPKGAQLGHANVLWMARALSSVNPVGPEDEYLSYLPLAHVYENLLAVFQAAEAGYAVSFVESLETLFENLREVSPTVLAGVPRVWEKLASIIELKVSDSTRLKRALYRAALELGRRAARARREGAPSAGLSLAHALARLVVLDPLKRRLGLDRTRIAICGAAPAAPELFHYFQALGVPLVEGYGQTESTGVVAVNPVDAARVGTVGPPLPGSEVRLADDDEILARGPHVFQGYFRDPELTAQTVDADGWLHTGDVGAWEDGHLRVVDRKKDIIVTAGGKNVTPSWIENKLKWSPYVQDAVVLGDGRSYLVALILIDEDNVSRFAQDRRVPFSTFEDLTRASEVRALVQSEVDRVNRTLSQAETIKRFALLPRRLYEEEGDVTPTRKVKRRNLERRYAELVRSLYG